MSQVSHSLIVETERLVLRRFKLTDVDDLLALDTDAQVRRFVEDGRPVTGATARADIEAWHAAEIESPTFGFWAAIEKTSGRFIGWFHLLQRTTSQSQDCELGYRLATPWWGQGFATEGSQALIDKAFREAEVPRVVAETMAIHIASRRVMEKAGMRHVRNFQAEWPVRLPGDEFGDVEYAITRSEWEPRYQGPSRIVVAELPADLHDVNKPDGHLSLRQVIEPEES